MFLNPHRQLDIYAKKILITEASGFIGGFFVDEALSRGLKESIEW